MDKPLCGGKIPRNTQTAKMTQVEVCVSHSVTFNSATPWTTRLLCSVHRILQARGLEWVAMTFSRGSSQPRDRPWVSCIAGIFFTS